MKASTALLAASTAMLALGAGYLGWQLGAARAEADEATRLARYLTARVAELERSHTSFPAVNAQPGLHPGSAAGAAVSAAPAAALPDDATPQSQGRPFAAPRMSAAQQRVQRGQARAHAKAMYSDFAAELGLSPEDANALYNLVVDRELSSMTDPPYGTEPIEALQARWTARQREFAAKTAATIGADGAARLQDYERSFGARAEIAQLGEQLSALDIPLSEAQRKSLLKAAQQDSEQFPGPRLDASQTPTQMQQAFANWDRDRKERLAAATRNILNPQQRQHFEDLRESEVEAVQDASGGNPPN